MDSEDVILLVEDNPDDACILGIALRKAGISQRLEVIRNPVEAMRYLEGEDPYGNRSLYPRPALLLISADLRLVSGLEVLRWVAHRPQLRGLPIVLLSDFPLDEGALEGLPPLLQQLVKPGGFGELVAFLRRMRWLLPDAPASSAAWRLAS